MFHIIYQQIKMRNHCTPIRMAEIQTTTNTVLTFTWSTLAVCWELNIPKSHCTSNHVGESAPRSS